MNKIDSQKNTDQQAHINMIIKKAKADVNLYAIQGGILGIITSLISSPIRLPARLGYTLAAIGPCVALSGSCRITYNMAQISRNKETNREAFKKVKGDARDIGYSGAALGLATGCLLTARYNASHGAKVGAMLAGGIATGITFFGLRVARNIRMIEQSSTLPSRVT